MTSDTRLQIEFGFDFMLSAVNSICPIHAVVRRRHHMLFLMALNAKDLIFVAGNALCFVHFGINRMIPLIIQRMCSMREIFALVAAFTIALRVALCTLLWARFCRKLMGVLPLQFVRNGLQILFGSVAHLAF